MDRFMTWSKKTKEKQEGELSSIQNGSGNPDQQNDAEGNRNDFCSSVCLQNIADIKNCLNTLVAEHHQQIEDVVRELRQSFTNVWDSFSILNGKLNELKNGQESTDERITETLNNNSDINREHLRHLQNQLSNYREDVFLKLVSRYVIDINITLYKRIAYRNYNLAQEGVQNIELENVQKLIIQRFSTLGILSHSSKDRDDFNPEIMIISNYPSIQTTDENLIGKVAISMIPRFEWTLPNLQSQSSTLTLNPEEVILYDNSIL